MKIRSILTATLAILTLAGCSKNDGEGTGIDATGEGGEAKVRFSIAVPKAAGTRAPQAATTDESKINDVHIYIFNADGTTTSDPNGGYFALPITAFNLVSGVYEMDTPILTTAGTKTIYVGVNLTASGIGGDYASEALFLAAITDVHTKLLQYDAVPALQGITMFGKEQKTLIADVNGGDNEVTIEIGRAVSRVITTHPTGSVLADWAGTDDMTFSIKNYFVSQDAHKSYVAPNYLAGTSNPFSLIYGVPVASFNSVLNIYNPSVHLGASPTPVPYVAIVPDQTVPGRENLNGFYIGENVPNTPGVSALQGNTTYAYIQTTVSATLTAKMNLAGDDVIYSGTDPIVGGVDDLCMVRVAGIADYICHEDNYEDVLDFLGDKYHSADVKGYIYPKAYVYYKVYLNSTETGKDKYNVYRNQFIHIAVTGVNVDINKPGGFGGGNPGDKTNPEVPVDPTDPDNPNPIVPPLPIDEEEATLTVNIKVKPWEYIVNSVPLE